MSELKVVVSGNDSNTVVIVKDDKVLNYELQKDDKLVELGKYNDFVKPLWDKDKWVESATAEEIAEQEFNQIVQPSEIEVLKQEKEILAQSVYDLTTIIELILTGGISE